MIDQFDSRPSSSEHLRLGPLGRYIDVFAQHLEERGYARWTVQEKIWVVAGFSRWLQSEKRGVENLDEQVVSEFLRYRGRKGLSRHGAAPALRDLLRHLRDAGIDHLEKERGNSARSRNVRLAAIHSFFRYVALHDPVHGALAQRVLAMPIKRYHRKQIQFLTRPEIDALIAAPDQKTWAGRRDQTLLLVAVQTGFRLSELIGLRCEDVALGTGAHLRCTGKGRKERCTPLRSETTTALRAWLLERNGQSEDPVFPSARGHALSPDGVEYVLAKYVLIARQQCPSLEKKRVTPHVLRHTAAMELLHSGVDRSVIALWLGHESMETTQIYLHADLELKEQALAKTSPFGMKMPRYRPDDKLLAFLKGL